MPDQSRVLVRLRFERLGGYQQLGRNVALFGNIHAPEEAGTRSVIFGLLPQADVELDIVDDRSAQEETALAFPAYLVGRCIFGIAVKLPDRLARLCFEGVEPAIAAGEYNLHLAVDLGRNRACILAVHDLVA